MRGQHQRVDRPGLLKDTKGRRRQEEVETAGFNVIGGAPTTLRVTGLMMMMNIWKFKTVSVFSCIFAMNITVSSKK